MANNYNSLPIKIDTVMASGWRALQTLNTGNLPSTAQQLSGSVTRMFGFRVVKVTWVGMTAAGHTFQIVDPNDNTVLLAGQAGTTLTDQEYDFENMNTPWRDFKVSVLTSGILYIDYRA